MIEAYKFNIIEDDFPIIKQNIIYENYPVVYLIHNNKYIYIGETTNIKNRFKDHLNTKSDFLFNKSKIIFSKYFNKSAIYDIETKLIKCFYVENKFQLINTKTQQLSHNYYKKEKYTHMFENKWGEMRNQGLALKGLTEIENDLLFKYSPFTEFSDEQLYVSKIILDSIKSKKESKSIISGDPGTGKTLVAFKILYDLFNSEVYDVSKLKIGFCIPQSSVRKTFKRLLKRMKIKVDVISGANLTNKFDILIIDEAHRLKSYFSKQAKDLKHIIKGENEYTTELNLAIENSKHLVLMYDSSQFIRPADIDLNYEFELPETFKRYRLTEQFRVKSGSNYTDFIKGLLQIDDSPADFSFGDYEFEVLDSIEELHKKIKEKNEQFDLSRMASGYYVDWISKPGKDKDVSSIYDFEEQGYKIKWNSTIEDWVNSPNAINEVGCIHTLQGVDLNYCGVIIGNDIYLDPVDKKIKVNSKNYYDRNGLPIKDDREYYAKLEKYIKNIYYVLLTRGISGTYLFIEDQQLKKYINKIIRIRNK